MGLFLVSSLVMTKAKWQLATTFLFLNTPFGTLSSSAQDSFSSCLAPFNVDFLVHVFEGHLEFLKLDAIFPDGDT